MNTPDDLALLAAEGLQVRIGSRRVCDALDLQLRRGESWALLGLNGSGKTTLLHTLAGLRPFVAGALAYCGRALHDWPAVDLARLRGLLPQDTVDAFPLTVREAVLTGRYPHGGGRGAQWWSERREDQDAAQAALARIGLAQLAQRDCATLSGGERRRVALAAQLALAPSIYLLDEPTSHLDPHHQIALLDILQAERRERRAALLMSLHDPNLAWRYGSHALLLFGDGAVLAGETAAVMTAANLTRLYQHPLRAHPTPDGTVYLAA
jgi:iron complex transport system ATP-binding protein